MSDTTAAVFSAVWYASLADAARCARMDTDEGDQA